MIQLQESDSEMFNSMFSCILLYHYVVEAGMGMEGNELSGAKREWEWFFKCVNFGNGNGKDLPGMGGIGNAENHSRTSLSSSTTSSSRSNTC